MQGQALITVCNHNAAMDDPLVVAAIVPREEFDNPKALRCVLFGHCVEYLAAVSSICVSIMH